MRFIWIATGRCAFFITLPLLALYLSQTKRTRVVVRVGDEILVHKAWLGSGHWILPGGGLHKDELPVEGAARELFEETGVQIDSSQLVTQYSGRTPFYLGFGIYTSIFSLVLPEKPILHLTSLEIIETTWLPLTSLGTEKGIGAVLEGVNWSAHS